ncbi:hypothetical protein MD588_06010 [Photobacterium sp. SDRW27]|uniref:hypothetical protein n=1 Tax=Photobacterium obscurum TaxID=2829490 RepID=UPI002243BCD4|nr:hypothetical protein [Photobacterium obscurum]MCW8328360.1 hypothetical protein [Photobacterium obscurum]
MNRILLVLMFGVSSAFADDSIVSSEASQVERELASEVAAKQITKAQADEMELNRADTYEVTSTVSVENLEQLIAEKLQDSVMPFYSIEFNDPNKDNEYRATVVEYFGKVE